MIPFETMGPCKRCGDFLNPCKCELMAKAELLEKMAETLECLKEMVKMDDSLGKAYAMRTAEQLLQEYRETMDANSNRGQ